MGAALKDDDALYRELLALPPRALFALYAEMLPGEARGAATVARALKDQARAGRFDDDSGTTIALLVFCLVDAPSSVAAFHLAKALAAFGRQAERAAPYVVDHVLELHVVDDESFWVFDGLLWSLGFLGGPAAKAMIHAVEQDRPPRCARPNGVYRGALSTDQRGGHHAHTLEGVRGLLAADPGLWRARRSKLERTRPTPAPGKTATWMVR